MFLLQVARLYARLLCVVFLKERLSLRRQLRLEKALANRDEFFRSVFCERFACPYFKA